MLFLSPDEEEFHVTLQAQTGALVLLNSAWRFRFFFARSQHCSRAKAQSQSSRDRGQGKSHPQ